LVSFTTRPLYPRGENPGTHWIGGCVGLRAVLDVVEKRKILASESIRTPAVQPIARHYTD
jgi:hypothetical protein